MISENVLPASKIDETGTLIKVADDGLVKVDGITVFRVVLHDGILHLQFCDHDRMRSTYRGTRFVEIPLTAIVGKLVDK